MAAVNGRRQKKGTQDYEYRLPMEIKNCLYNYGIANEVTHSFIAHLLYRSSVAGNLSEISYQDILSGKIEVNKSTLSAAKNELNSTLWGKLTGIVRQFSTEDFGIERAAKEITFEIDCCGRYTDDNSSTPVSLWRLIEELLDIQAKDRVADMGCGRGNLLCFLSNSHSDASFCGYEIDPKSADIAENQVWKPNGSIKIIRQDVFSDLGDTVFDKAFSYLLPRTIAEKLADAKNVPDIYAETFPELFENSKYRGSATEWVLAQSLCQRMSDNGRIIIILPHSCLTNKADLAIRKYFVEKELVQCVVMLPGRFRAIPYRAALVVLSCNNQKVKLIDAEQILEQSSLNIDINNDFHAFDEVVSAIQDDSDCDYSRYVSLENLRDMEYILQPGIYAVKEMDKAENTVPLAEVIKGITRGVRIDPKQLCSERPINGIDTRYLTLTNLHDGVVDVDLPYLTEDIPAVRKHCIKNNSLILSKNSPIKFAIVSVPEGEKIVLGSNLYAIELDESRIDPYYLQAFLVSNQGMTALQNIATGASVKVIGVDRLKEVRIPLPELSKQERIASQCRETLAAVVEAQAKMNQAANKLYRIFEEYKQDD